ncbi:hypothetical protein [Microbacterium sp. 77mftsu3.1]|uniref:hypothetical protein n=1 Tax=Microbacterium sp. 77mftsu3.1 TaxID=1761802 RepID=UPI000371A88D|nr:hypothetical protein [Microbacterium sp. 77mftsu3.1]SDH47028.1 hypothetical protein SAMN04488590_3348 [Microbacterium sp. 77mftsu3.1]
MANPFLVLGGIAVGIITAAFGVIAVPGWVASAQDASATNDVSQVSLVQAALSAESGRYAASITALETAPATRVTVASAQNIATATDRTGKHSITVARSDSGRYFARLSGKAAIATGATAEAAVASAGTTVTGGVTAEGVTIPPLGPGIVARNLFKNPTATSLYAVSASPWSELALVNDFPGEVKTAIRATRTSDENTRDLDLITGLDTPFGKDTRVTLAIRVSQTTKVQLSLRRQVHDYVAIGAPDQSFTLSPGVNEIDLVFRDTAPLVPTITSGVTIRSDSDWVGRTMEVTRISITEASDGIGFFHGGSGKVGNATSSWLGAPGESMSVLRR